MNKKCLLVLLIPAIHWPVNALSPETLDDLTRQWLALEHQESQLLRHWQQQKPALKQRIELLQAEKSELETVLKNSQSSQDDVDEKRNRLLAQQNDLEVEQSLLEEAMAGLMANTDSLRAMLTDSLKKEWDQESLSASDNNSTSSELQLVLAKLSKLASAQKQISISEDLVKTPDGKEVMVKRLYLGAALAWFSSADGQYKGVGQIREGQWHWQFSEQLDSQPIRQAISVYEKKAQPEFSLLPIQLVGAKQ